MFTEDQIAKIKADFPDEAVQSRTFKNRDGSEKEFSGYKPAWIVERLNDVFGVGGWNYRVVNQGNIENQVWVLGELLVVDGETKTFYQNFGQGEFSKTMSVGDAFKSAGTDAMGKCASYFGIGEKAYKGLETRKPIAATATTGAVVSDTESMTEELIVLLEKHKVNKKEIFVTLCKNVLNREVQKKADLTPEEMAKIIHHLKVNEAPF